MMGTLRGHRPSPPPRVALDRRNNIAPLCLVVPRRSRLERSRMHDDRRDTQTLTTERAIPERGVEKYRCATVRRAREEETATGTYGGLVGEARLHATLATRAVLTSALHHPRFL